TLNWEILQSITGVESQSLLKSQKSLIQKSTEKLVLVLLRNVSRLKSSQRRVQRSRKEEPVRMTA
ncbi:MAG: hypothetical protein PUP93_04825, partial [Rhizonema sp. NSF051]|nr:hypothetical protein [Rhizonema sp. NSF051]